MDNNLTNYERGQLVNGGICNLHEHDVNLRDHQHLETLQSIETVRVVSSNYTVSYTDDIVLVDSSQGNVTVTLPPARGGRKFCIIKKSAANSVIVTFSGGETLLGITSVVITSLADLRWFKGFLEGYIPL